VRRNLTVGAVLERVLHSEVLAWLAVLAGLTLGFAAAFWAIERRRNPSIQGSPARGLAESAWWSVVTVSTVGYGDRVPLTRRGKLLMRDYAGMGMRFGLDPALERRLSLEVVRASQSPEYRTFREAMLGVADGNAPVPSVP